MVFNDICGEFIWSDIVMILVVLVFFLMFVEDFCELVVFFFEVDYQGYWIDSVLWEFLGGMLENSIDLFFVGVSYVGVGIYIYILIVYNSCGSSVVFDEFVIDIIFVIDFGLIDMICIMDGLYNFFILSFVGGIWQDLFG